MRISKPVNSTLTTVSLLILICVIGFVTLVQTFDRLSNRVSDDPTTRVSNEARALHFSSLTADLHSDALMWRRDMLERNDYGHVDVPRLVEGGLSLQVLSAGTNFPLGPTLFDRKSESWPDYYTFHAIILGWPQRTFGSQLQRALFMAERLHGFVERSGGQLRLIQTLSDLEDFVYLRSMDSLVIGSLLSLEGAHALEGNVSNLRSLYDAGFRIIGLTHFIDNPFAGSANGMKRGGLTRLGLELLKEMELLGVVPDLSHASPQTIRDVLAATSKPVFVTHTGVRGTCDKERNLADEQIRAIAKSGGVIGISFAEILICGDQIEAIVRSIQHVVNLVGDRHVALGSDFDGAVTTPFDASGLPALTQALMDAGFGEESMRRILGENAVRVLRAWLPQTNE